MHCSRIIARFGPSVICGSTSCSTLRCDDMRCMAQLYSRPPSVFSSWPEVSSENIARYWFTTSNKCTRWQSAILFKYSYGLLWSRSSIIPTSQASLHLKNCDIRRTLVQFWERQVLHTCGIAGLATCTPNHPVAKLQLGWQNFSYWHTQTEQNDKTLMNTCKREKMNRNLKPEQIRTID